MEDKRSILRDEKPFTYKLVGSNRAYVYYRSRQVFTAIGSDYAKLQKAISSEDEYNVQRVLAKMTGNFKRGNER